MAYAIATIDTEKRQHSLDMLPPIQYFVDSQDERLCKTLFKCDAMLKECKAIVHRQFDFMAQQTVQVGVDLFAVSEEKMQVTRY